MPVVEGLQKTEVMSKCSKDDMHMENLVRCKVIVKFAWEPAFGDTIGT